MWRFSLHPEVEYLPHSPLDTTSAILGAFRAYDLPIVEALVHYFHASAGFPVQLTWIMAIKEGNYSTWSGLA